MAKKTQKIKVLKKLNEYIVFIETEKDVGLSFIICEYAKLRPKGINRLLDQKRYFVCGTNARYQDITGMTEDFVLGSSLEEAIEKLKEIYKRE